MAEIKLFDLENTLDISEKVKSELNILNVRICARHLLSLFDLKKRLTIDEILVGLWRKHEIAKTRVWVASTTYNLCRKGLLKKVPKTKGTYERT